MSVVAMMCDLFHTYYKYGISCLCINFENIVHNKLFFTRIG